MYDSQMAIPDYQTVMLPLLKYLSSGREHHLQDLTSSLAEHFSLSEEEKSVLLPSGKYPVFKSRISWAGSYMKAAGLIGRPRRGYMKITEIGASLLKGNPHEIDVNLLKEYPDFVAFLDKSKKNVKASSTSVWM